MTEKQEANLVAWCLGPLVAAALLILLMGCASKPVAYWAPTEPVQRVQVIPPQTREWSTNCEPIFK